VPNKFPALCPKIAPAQTELGPVFLQMGGYGAHEVVVESREHSTFLAHQPLEHIERVLEVVHGRVVALAADPHLRAIVVFKNHGERAGTSLSHPHWQIIATPVVPSLLRHKHAIATDYFDRTSKCLYCVTLEKELEAGARVLATNDHYVAILPFASRVPYQVRLLPRVHRASFSSVPESELGPLASILREVLGRLYDKLGDPDFNLTLDTAPLGDEQKRYFLWHIDLLPRLTTPAGFASAARGRGTHAAEAIVNPSEFRVPNRLAMRFRLR
jgi:UDPglucose--hexose-1-phosphate uridylyltransferase